MASSVGGTSSLSLERPGVTITTRTQEVEAGALGMYEAYQFIVEYQPHIVMVLPVLTGVLQLCNAILQRRNIKLVVTAARRMILDWPMRCWRKRAQNNCHPLEPKLERAAS
jgi:hypothetical protein